jgi:predicted alpha/beta superfamily hydrolase
MAALKKKSIAGYCIFLLLIIFFFPIRVFAQFTVLLQVKDLPAVHASGPVYLAGNFNSWSPGSNAFLFAQAGNSLELELKNVPAGFYEYKLTRGSWGNVECTFDGKDIANHTLTLSSDTTLQLVVAGWMDDFTVANKHTASANVLVMDTAFAMPQLGRARRILLYLPPGYQAGSKRYPVLYMHDGQNIFDAYTSGFGEWGVDECLDSLIKNGTPGCIVVAIDNGEKRMTEYNPYRFASFGEGEGDRYIDFIAQTLKPYIDKQYRTLASKENCIIAGSSMGGLISFYALLKYPSVFGKAGIFSPAFWTAGGEIDKAVDSLGSKVSGKLFFYMGAAEGKKYVDDMVRVQEKIGLHSSAMIYSLIDPEGLHNEAAWKKWFAEFYNWMLSDGLNAAGKLSD